jgi:DNA topoisomerase-1
MVLSPKSEKIVAELRPLIAEATEVFIGTPPDADGERIAWQLTETLSIRNPKRVVFSELTLPAIEKALASPRAFRFNLAKSQSAYWFVEDLSHLASQVIQAISGKYIDLGLVEALGLEILSNRGKQLSADNALPNFSVDLQFSPERQRELSWRAQWNPRNWLLEGETGVQDRKIAQTISELKTVTVVSHKEGKISKNPSPPFTTASLLRSASNCLYMDPLRALELATKLYESGFITHPITDNPLLLDTVTEEILAMAANFGWQMPEVPRIYEPQKPSLVGLECVRPVNLSVETAGVTDDEKNLYKLIRLRTIASQMASALYSFTKVVLWAPVDNMKAFFEAKNQRLLKPGFLALLNEEQSQDGHNIANPIPRLMAQEELPVRQGFFSKIEKPFNGHLDKNSLLDILAGARVNRPLAQAATCCNLSRRGYASTDRRGVLRIAPMGQETADLLAQYFPTLTLEGSKSLWASLDLVERNEENWLVAMATFQNSLVKDLSHFGLETSEPCPICGDPLKKVTGLKKDTPVVRHVCFNDPCGAIFLDQGGAPGARLTLYASNKIKCPNCGGPVAIVKGYRNGRSYSFWSCRDRERCASKFYEVDGTIGSEYFRIVDAHKPCPDCGQPILGQKETKGFNSYYRWYCANKDECGATFKNNNGQPGDKIFLPDERHPCPECGFPLTHCYGRHNETQFNYWICQTNGGCQMKYRDDQGVPGLKLTSFIKSDRICPDCQSPLVLVKGAKSGSDFSFWACGNRDNCGSKFFDDDGEIGKRLNTVTETSFLCVECHRRLNLRKGISKGQEYVNWICSNPDCLQRYRDNHGQPGEAMAATIRTEIKCPLCGFPLAHVIKKGLNGYDFWACHNHQCGANFLDNDGEPGQIKGKKGFTLATDYKCPYCLTKLRRRKGHNAKFNQEFDFFFCPNKYCEREFPSKDGLPVFPTSRGPSEASQGDHGSFVPDRAPVGQAKSTAPSPEPDFTPEAKPQDTPAAPLGQSDSVDLADLVDLTDLVGLTEAFDQAVPDSYRARYPEEEGKNPAGGHGPDSEPDKALDASGSEFPETARPAPDFIAPETPPLEKESRLPESASEPVPDSDPPAASQ